MSTPQRWGVTVDEVSALAPHITIKADAAEPLTDDPVFGATQPRAITVSQVESFIEDVASRVDIRTIRASAIIDPDVMAKIDQARHDLTRNGAGAYLVAAAFPAKAGLNDQSSLSAELWNRFTSGLEELTATIAYLTDPGTVVPGADTTTGLTEGFFQLPQIPDVPAPGTYRDCPYPGSWGW